MKRVASISSIILGLALVAGSLVAGCAHPANGTRSSSVAQAAFITASVAVCTLADDPASHYGALEADLNDAPEMVPEDLLTDDFHFDANTSTTVSHETVPEESLGDDGVP